MLPNHAETYEFTNNGRYFATWTWLRQTEPTFRNNETKTEIVFMNIKRKILVIVYDSTIRKTSDTAIIAETIVLNYRQLKAFTKKYGLELFDEFN